jgi:hypothetical protein
VVPMVARGRVCVWQEYRVRRSVLCWCVWEESGLSGSENVLTCRLDFKEMFIKRKKVLFPETLMGHTTVVQGYDIRRS